MRVDSAQVTLLGLLDLSAAFDTVDHDILLTWLQVLYGVSGSALAWITFFIQHQSQSVNFNGQISARLQLQYGVLQGSVLGPLLFILYTLDVISIATSNGVGAHSYADDSQLYLHCPSTNQSTAASRLAECIESVERWMRSNRLKLNSDKTQFMWLPRVRTTAGETECMQIGEHCIKFSTSDSKESGSDFRSRTEDGPACQQHNKKLLLPAETAAIHQAITHNGSHEDIGPFPRIKSQGLPQQHFLRSHKLCPAKVAICSQRDSQADHEHKEIRPHHICDQGSASFASHLPTHHFQNCNLCSKLTPWPWPDISQLILHPHLANRGESPSSFYSTGTPHHTSNQDKSLRAEKLPCGTPCPKTLQIQN